MASEEQVEHKAYDPDGKSDEAIIKALEAGDYTVSYEAPDCVTEHTAIDGRTFYIVEGDDATHGMDYGSCTLKVAGYVFSCSLMDGEWDEDLSFEVLEAIKSTGDIITEVEDPAEAYALANGLNYNDLETYPADEEYIPADVDELHEPSYCANTTEYFEGKAYYVIDDPEPDCDGEYCIAHAVEEGTKPDDYGRYECVELRYSNIDDCCGELCDVQGSDVQFDAVNEELIDWF